MKKPYRRRSNLKVQTAELSFKFDDWIANLEPRKAAKILLKHAGEGDRTAMRYVRAFVANGVTESLIHRIDSKVRHIELPAQLRRTQGALSFEWRIGTPKPGQLTDEIYFALLALLAISSGEAARFKECRFCKTWFLGNAKARYCSDKCGSRIRIERKRKRDRERQMI